MLARQNGVEGTRSKNTIEREVTGPLRVPSNKDAVDEIEQAFLIKFYGKNAKDKQQRQALLFGRAEIEWMRSEAERLLRESGGSAGAAKGAAEAWIKEEKNNLNQLRDQSALSAKGQSPEALAAERNTKLKAILAISGDQSGDAESRR